MPMAKRLFVGELLTAHVIGNILKFRCQANGPDVLSGNELAWFCLTEPKASKINVSFSEMIKFKDASK